MKNLLSLFTALSIGLCCSAQSFSGKTNDISVSFKKPGNPAVAISLPTVKWITPKPEYTNSQNNVIEIEASVTSDTDLKSVTLIVGDGTNTRGEKPLDLTSTRTIRIKQQLKLFDGQNVIEIMAETAQGGKVSSSRSILVGKDAIADAVSIDRKDYVLLFATDQYDHWTDLVNPIDDAQSLAKVLSEKYGFQTEIVQNATQDEVYNKLRDYAERKFKPQDQLMIFFAGHGYFDDTFGEGFVVAKNSLENDKAKTSYISHNRLRGILQNIPSEHIFLAMDVCFGGTFDPVIASTRGALEVGETSDSEYLVRKLGQRTRKYLTSGGKEYVSDGIPGKHSPFTLKLLQALSDGGGSDRILTISEIKAYVEKLKPEPRMGSFGDDKPESDFVFVAKN
ncbi:MAG TPA: caspase family protein [Cyclobacteriaceae bacterium]|nr:caspase family protein [Cyclobacteriaceae bacterium]